MKNNGGGKVVNLWGLTMTSDDEIWFVLSFGGLFFGLGVISIVGHAYLCFFKMRKIVEHLSNSPGVLARKSLSSDGLVAKYFVLTCVCSFLVFPTLAIKGGALVEKGYLSFL